MGIQVTAQEVRTAAMEAVTHKAPPSPAALPAMAERVQGIGPGASGNIFGVSGPLIIADGLSGPKSALAPQRVSARSPR